MTATSALKSAFGKRRSSRNSSRRRSDDSNNNNNHNSKAAVAEAVLSKINAKEHYHSAKDRASRIYNRRKIVSFTPSTKSSPHLPGKRWSGSTSADSSTDSIVRHLRRGYSNNGGHGSPTFSAFDKIYKNHSRRKGTVDSSDSSGSSLFIHRPSNASEVSTRSNSNLNPNAQKPILAQPPIMTVRNTDDEWKALIADVRREMKVERTIYRPPPLMTDEHGEKGIAHMLDHTLLKIESTPRQIDELCQEARKEGFKAVCVRKSYVSRAVSNLRSSNIPVACVIGFHEGTYSTSEKVSEAATALSAGATELDIVINYPDLIAGNYSPIYTELATLRSLAPSPIVLKLILETSQLTPAQVVAGCVLAGSANFDFVKTSTGFNGRGATVDDIFLMRAACTELRRREIGRRVEGEVVQMQIKASGGVRSLKDCMMMAQAGATRIGTSSGVWVMQEAREVIREDMYVRPGLSRLWPDEGFDGYVVM